MTTKMKVNRISPMTLTERDVRIVLAVYENRLLRRDQIQRLFFAGASLQAASARLKKLCDHKFLDKLQRPVSGGTSQAVYALDKRGADVVAATSQDGRRVNWNRHNNRVEWFFMEHTLGVSEVRVCLDVALASRSESLLFYQRGDRSHLRRISVPEAKKKYFVVAPDAFFGIETGRGKYYFFVEVDMGTETLSRFSEKVVAYKRYWKSGKYQDEYGFKSFRVLTVCESERRLVNLLQATEKAGGRKMFLFTTFEGIKGAIFKPLWFSPGSDEPTTFFD